MDEQEQMQFFYEIFDASLPRLGAGDDASTRKALNMLLSAKHQRKDTSDSRKAQNPGYRLRERRTDHSTGQVCGRSNHGCG